MRRPSDYERAENSYLREIVKPCTCRATTLGRNLSLSSLNEEAARLVDERYYFEEPNKSVTLTTESFPPWQGWAWPRGLRWQKHPTRMSRREVSVMGDNTQ